MTTLPHERTQISTGAIHSAMVAIVREIEAITKDGYNQHQKFKFRGIDQAYNAIHPLLAKHGVYMRPCLVHSTESEYKSQGGSTMNRVVLHVTVDFVAADGSATSIGPVVGEGADAQDKASGKAWSMAIKYAIFTAFAVPTEDTPDADKDTPPPRAASNVTPIKPTTTAAASPPAQEPATGGRAAIGARISELVGGDRAKGVDLMNAILPGWKNVANTTDDQLWRVQIALGLMKGCGNDLAKAKAFCTEQLGTPWVDKMNDHAKDAAIKYLKIGRAHV